VADITRLSGGHPYYCQALCYEAFDHALLQKRETIAKADVKSAEQKIIKDLYNSFLSSYWHRATLRERQLLRELATGKGHRHISAAELRRMVEWQLLDHDERRLAFSADLFKTWTLKATKVYVD
jgi:hypothetical protein